MVHSPALNPKLRPKLERSKSIPFGTSSLSPLVHGPQNIANMRKNSLKFPCDNFNLVDQMATQQQNPLIRISLPTQDTMGVAYYQVYVRTVNIVLKHYACHRTHSVHVH